MGSRASADYLRRSLRDEAQLPAPARRARRLGRARWRGEYARAFGLRSRGAV